MGTKAPAGTVLVTGLASSGKSILLSLLTGQDHRHISSQKYGTKFYIQIPHPNINILHEAEGAHKELVLPFIQIAEAPGLIPESDGANTHALNTLKEATGIVAVINSFSEKDPNGQKSFILSQLINEDKRIVGAQLEQAQADLEKKPNNPELQKSVKILEDLSGALAESNSSKNLRDAPKDIKLLSALPITFVVNTTENEAGIRQVADFSICLKLEHDINSLESDGEKAEFMKEYNIERLKYPELARYIYTNTNNIMFFTSGDKDATGWGIRNGSTAVDAAGVIHTDIAKGFINAEIISWDDFLRFKSIATCKHRGLVQKLPRDYIMKDCDIATFNFSPPK